MRALSVWVAILVFLAGPGVSRTLHHIHPADASSHHGESHDHGTAHGACAACVSAHNPGAPAPPAPLFFLPAVVFLSAPAAQVEPLFSHTMRPHHPRGPPTLS